MISLCWFDITHAIMSLSRFHHCPRQGHIDCLKRVCGYIRKFPQGAIRFHMGIPDHESIFGEQPNKYDWMETVYSCPTEVISEDAPEPKGNLVRTSTYCDANLLHDLITERYTTGLLHFLNQTPIDHYLKRQNQVELATYGSEFMVARQAIEQIIDLRYTLRMHRVLVDGPSWLFRDNKSVVTSSTIPHSSLNKCWNMLSYHKVCEAIASNIMRFEHIPTNENPADILTKVLPWHKAHVNVEPLLFWKGAMANESSNPVSVTTSTGPTSGE